MGRGRREKVSNNNFKYLVLLAGGIVLIMFITFIVTLVIYNNKLKNSNYSSLTTEKIADLVPNVENNTTSYVEEESSEIGKSIEEVINTMEQKNEETNNSKTENIIKEETTNSKEETIETNTKPVQEVKDPEFILPVEGTLMREYAKDNLVYSETLKEWVIHTGIDIKADKTTVVKAAEAGKVTAIKNDPRYGITVIIEHVNGFETRYANLLTAEFVTVGEEVTKGQTIGTVGNTATFEILDDSHLHFEILKNGEYQAPELFIEI